MNTNVKVRRVRLVKFEASVWPVPIGCMHPAARFRRRALRKALLAWAPQEALAPAPIQLDQASHVAWRLTRTRFTSKT